MLLPRRLSALLAVACLTACTAQQPAPVTTTSTDAGGGVHTVAAPGKPAPATPTTPAPKIDFIRATKWDAVTLTDVIDKRKVTLAGGKGSAGEVAYALGTQPVAYADANGDGLEDALVAVTATGKAAVTYLYLWLWDAKQNAAVQVEDPVGKYSSCGNALTSFGPGSPMGFQISESIRDVYDNQACGTTPLHKLTRTIGVDQGALVMTKPVLAYGGICYQTYRDTSDYPTPQTIRVAPSAAAAVAQAAQHTYPVIPTYADDRAWGDGWVQVSWLTDAMKKQGLYYGVCGFLWLK